MKNITISDLTSLRFVSNPAISPDGAFTAYAVHEQNKKDNCYASYIHLLDNNSGKSRQLTFAGKESSFVWDDDKTLLFPAERTEDDKPARFARKTVFYRLNIAGGEACRAFDVPLTIVAAEPLGNGKYCLEALVDLNEPAADMDETLRADEADYHVLEEAPFWSNGRGFISRLRYALYLFDAGSGELKKITSEFMNVSGFCCKNGKIGYIGCDYQDNFSLYGEAHLYDIATGEDKILVEKENYAISSIILTDSGIVLAMTDMKPWGLGQLKDFYRCDYCGNKLEKVLALDMCIGPDVLFDCSYGGGNAVKAVGDDVYFIAQKKFRCEIYRLGADNSFEKVVPFDGCILAFDADGESTVFVGNAANCGGDIYLKKDGDAKRVSGVNDAFFADHHVSKAEYIPFTNSDGVQIDGWILKPYGYDPEKTYPGVLEIHGGPRCTYGEVFFHEMQALAGAGYYVFFCNPRGSEGYGEEFADLRARYGQIDYQDLMEFTDHVLANFPQIDKTRIGAAGGSYGGFMCNWIEGHTDRFAAIASQRSVSNWVADFGSSEIGYTFDKNEMGADPWTDMQKMWDQSPLKYACNAKTPILFIHSLGDYNCTLDQGLEMFTAMKYFGVPTRMCLFEGENHSLSRSGKPRHRIRRLEEIMNWFERYLR